MFSGHSESCEVFLPQVYSESRCSVVSVEMLVRTFRIWHGPFLGLERRYLRCYLGLTASFPTGAGGCEIGATLGAAGTREGREMLGSACCDKSRFWIIGRW